MTIVDAGGTVNIAPATYFEDVTISNQVTLSGTNAVISGTLSFGVGSALGSGSGGVTATTVSLAKGGLGGTDQTAVNTAVSYVTNTGTLSLTGSAPFAANVTGSSGDQSLIFTSSTGLLTANSTISTFQTVNYGPITSSLTLTLSTYTSVAEIVGSSGSGTTTLVATSSATVFNVTGSNSGNVTGGPAFSSIESLQGSTGNDTFAITGSGSLAGTIVGGLGTDVLTYAGYASNVSVSLAASTATGVNAGVAGAFSGIERIVGGSGADTLSGYSSASTFALSGNYAGAVDSTVGNVSFETFETLAGGAAAAWRLPVSAASWVLPATTRSPSAARACSRAPSRG